MYFPCFARLYAQYFLPGTQLGVGGRAVCYDGAVVHAGTMAELAENEELQQDLLGLGLGAHQ